jgi:nitroreductase
MSDIRERIKSRRSVRKFADSPLSEEAVDKMLEAALWAPSASNRQNWKFVAVKNKEIIKAMAGSVRAAVEDLKASVEADDEDKLALLTNYGGYFSFFESAPLVIAVFFNPRPNFVNVITGKNIRPEDNLEQTTAAGAAIQNLLLAAHEAGYGACWMSGPLVAENEIAAILKQKGMRLAALIPVGVPLETPAPPKRKDPRTLIEKID